MYTLKILHNLKTNSLRFSKLGIQNKLDVREGVQKNLGLQKKVKNVMKKYYAENGQICHINMTLFFFH